MCLGCQKSVSFYVSHTAMHCLGKLMHKWIHHGSTLRPSWSTMVWKNSSNTKVSTAWIESLGFFSCNWWHSIKCYWLFCKQTRKKSEKMSGAIFTADVWLLYVYFFVRFSILEILNFSTKEGQVDPLSFLKLVYVWCVCMCMYMCKYICIHVASTHL